MFVCQIKSLGLLNFTPKTGRFAPFRGKTGEEEKGRKIKRKRLEQAETAEQLLEKMKAASKADALENTPDSTEKIPENGKGTQVDFTI